MCYDVEFVATNINQLSDLFPELIYDSQIEIDFEKTVHILGHAYGDHPIVYRHKEDLRLHCRLMEWGVIPYYIKDEKDFLKRRASMLNARSERILDDKTSYWYKIRNNRCLIPVSAIYEHRKIAKKGWTKKVPYHVGLHKEKLFCIPALYSIVELPDKSTGEMVKRFTYTMITRSANEVMRNIHNEREDDDFRMPLFVPIAMAKDWLNVELAETEYRKILNYEMPSEELNHYPVWTIRTGKERPDGKKKNEYFEWAGLPPLGEANPE